jgi:hypothetical protein
VTADGRPAKDDWVEFACPSRVEFRQRRVDEAVELVRRLRPDGLSLDFIRHFVFWEMVAPDADPARLPDACYCPYCLRRFAATLDAAAELPVDDPAAAAAWIRANAPDEWTRFKEEAISSLAWQIIQAAKAVKSNLRVNLHVVPWRAGDFDGAIGRVAGQDRATLGHLADYLSPMCYSHMLYRPPEWISSVVRDVAATGACPVLPSIQVAPAYREGPLSVQVFEASLRAALEPPSAGVVLWKWDDIAADPAEGGCIRRVLGEQPVADSPPAPASDSVLRWHPAHADMACRLCLAPHSLRLPDVDARLAGNDATAPRRIEGRDPFSRSTHPPDLHCGNGSRPTDTGIADRYRSQIE